MNITIKDISDEEVLLSGGISHRQTLETPEERQEISRTYAEGLNVNHAYLVSDGTRFAYTDDNFEDVPKEELQALLAGKATAAQLTEIGEWLEGEGSTKENDIHESIAEKAQDILEHERN